MKMFKIVGEVIWRNISELSETAQQKKQFTFLVQIHTYIGQYNS